MTVEDPKTAVRGYFYDHQPSTQKMSKRTWRKIQICVENGGKHPDRFKLNSNCVHRDFVATLYSTGVHSILRVYNSCTKHKSQWTVDGILEIQRGSEIEGLICKWGMFCDTIIIALEAFRA